MVDSLHHMRMMRMLAHLIPLLAVGVACSSSAGHVPATTTTRVTGASGSAALAAAPAAAPAPVITCTDAVAPLATHWRASTSTLDAAFDSARTNLRQALADLCQVDAWSPQSRACLRNADSLRAFDQCLAALPAQQLAHVTTTSNAIVAGTAVSAATP